MYDFRLQRTDGSPSDPPTYRGSVLNWRQGDQIPLTADWTLRVLGVRDDDADQPPALVVEDLPGLATSAALRFRRFVRGREAWQAPWRSDRRPAPHAAETGCQNDLASSPPSWSGSAGRRRRSGRAPA